MNICGYTFEAPVELKNCDFLDFACVYAILCLTGGKYYLKDIGQTGEAETRLLNHDRKDCWARNCDGILYVSILRMPSDRYTEKDRCVVESSIREDLKPPCGDR